MMPFVLPTYLKNHVANSWADPLASKIAFHSKVSTHRAITLDITEQLTLEKDNANLLFNMKSPLLRAVFDFGCPWLDTSNQLTFHDPLVAMSLLHHDLCSFERGFVQVETHPKQTIGATTFTPDPNGNVEISKSINIEKFFTILTKTLNN